MCEKYLQDENFLNRLKQRLISSKQLMLEAKIEGFTYFFFILILFFFKVLYLN